MQRTIFPCKQDVYQETTPLSKSQNLILAPCTFLSEWQASRILTGGVWELVRVNTRRLAVVRLPRRDMVQRAAKVKIYTEQLQLQKPTLDDMGCMINHGGQGAPDSRSKKKKKRKENESVQIKSSLFKTSTRLYVPNNPQYLWINLNCNANITNLWREYTCIPLCWTLHCSCSRQQTEGCPLLLMLNMRAP